MSSDVPFNGHGESLSLINSFDGVIARVSASVAGELRDALVARLTRAWLKPPCSALEIALRRGVSESGARTLLFAPSPDERGMGVYPLLLDAAPPPAAPRTHPLRATRALVLLLASLHAGASWPSAAAFIVNGGLHAAASLLNDDDLSLRSLALDVLLTCVAQREQGKPTSTSSSPSSAGAAAATTVIGYDWFAAPSGGADDARLHGSLLSLGRGRFIADLLQNRKNAWPGASQAALEILAFWLSWARAGHAREGGLRLSFAGLEALRDWAERPIRNETDALQWMTQTAEIASGPLALPNTTNEVSEADLARRLYDDFLRFGPGDEALPAAPAAAPALIGLAEPRNLLPPLVPRESLSAAGWEDGDAAAAIESTAATTTTSATEVTPLSIATTHKEAGNAHFRGERWREAALEYSQGLTALGVISETVNTVSPSSTTTLLSSIDSITIVTLFSNRALARLRAAGFGSSATPSSSCLADTRTARLALSSHSSSSININNYSAEESLWKDAAVAGSLPPIIALLLGALSDSTRALGIDSLHQKAALRRAQALVTLGRARDGAVVARALLERARASSSTSGGAVPELATAASSLLSAALALAALENSTSVSSSAAATAAAAAVVNTVDDESEASILAALLARDDFGGSERDVDALPFREERTILLSKGFRRQDNNDDDDDDDDGVDDVKNMDSLLISETKLPQIPQQIDKIISGGMNSSIPRKSQPLLKTSIDSIMGGGLASRVSSLTQGKTASKKTLSNVPGLSGFL